MKLLLDTHILYWLLTDDENLTKSARALILDNTNEIYYSTATLWELQIKHRKHPDNTITDAQDFEKFFIEAGYKELYIKSSHIFELDTLNRPDNAPHHNDPFDRILIAQAKCENMFFITHDKNLKDYDESCIIIV